MLGHGVLPFIERCPLFGAGIIQIGTSSFERGVFYSECPLSKVPLYTEPGSDCHVLTWLFLFQFSAKCISKSSK